MTSRRQAIPPPEVVERNLVDEPIALVGASAYRVCSWRPGPAGSGEPCTQVHLIVPVVEGVSVALRLKSARALDELVGVLLEYRREVWK